MKSQRLKSIDAARGIALFFSLLSHFGTTYFQSEATRGRAAILWEIGLIATPTFLIVSGLLLGFLYRTSGGDFGQLQRRLMDRGLFLLLVGHLLIGLAFVPNQHSFPISLSTDAIGVALIFGPWLITRLGRGNRILLGASLYLLGWVLVGFWRPAGYGAFIEEILAGTSTHASRFPILQWLGVYLASSVCGERLGVLYLRRRLDRVAYEFGAISGGLLTAAVGVKMLLIAAQSNPATRDLAVPLHEVFGLGAKYPPGPVYLLFFGGVAFAIVALCAACEFKGWGGRVMGVAAEWGEASLAIFVVQFYVFWLGVYYLSPNSVLLAPAFFAAVLVLMAVFARQWCGLGANRFITVGLCGVPWAPRAGSRILPSSSRQLAHHHGPDLAAEALSALTLTTR